jgi:hypothetical protein
MRTRDYPGGHTREEWVALPVRTRNDMAARAQCDVLLLWRDCPKKACRRARRCPGKDGEECLHRGWPRVPEARKRETDRIRAWLDGVPGW